MSKNALDELFGSRVRVKILKFFFRNYPADFDVRVLALRLQESATAIRKEIELMVRIRLLKKKNPRYTLNQDFEFFRELRELILKSSPAEKDRMIRRISALGRVRLAVISGIFMNNTNTVENFNPVADLFIVGDDVNRTKLKHFLKNLEAEVGAEIKFSLMEREEFEYRYGMFDRFVRVLLEGPHEKIINRIGI